MTSERPVVVVAGASGFVGQSLGPALRERFHAIGLSRSAREPGGGYDAWRAADLFSLLEAERALEGADVAVYLVHSMMPRAGLTQARFEDLDLVCADNFARAAAKTRVRRIVYLGGLIAEHAAPLSRHLESRLEVERALGAHGVPVTTLRAGLIVGAGGSSFDMLFRLVERLPAMILPAWTATRTHPIALEDVVRLLAFAIARDELAGRTFDVGGPDVMTYREMLETTADVLGVRRWFVSVPLFTPGLSRLWVTLVTGAPRELVAPLVQSLRHEMVARDRALQDLAGVPGVPFREALRGAIDRGRAAPPRRARAHAPSPRRVRSVQRLELPAGRDALWAAHEYFRWLPRAFRPFLVVDVTPDAEHARISIPVLGISLLELTLSRERSTPDRPLLYITGGALSGDDGRGRLELRQLPGSRTLLAAVHDFIPRLPWFVYRYTQALAHLYVMARFDRHLRALGEVAPVRAPSPRVDHSGAGAGS